MKYLLLGAAALALGACSQEKSGGAEGASKHKADVAHGEDTAPADGMEAVVPELTASEKLDDVLNAQPQEKKARYQYRHPKETLEFFGVEPGMTVVDILPGEPGWYGEILVPYLGPDGIIVGADYSVDLWSKFGGQYSSAEALERKQSFVPDYIASVDAIRGEEGAQAAAFQFGSLPDNLAGTADVVLMIRAAQHLNRFDDGAPLAQALDDLMTVLKPGGVVGVVQHRAQEDMPDDWANGNNGYLKQSRIVAAFEAAGFELAGESDINANPADRPAVGENVWRLPPSNDSADALAIGESDRMTLKFRKPE